MGQERSTRVFGPLSCLQSDAAVVYGYLDVCWLDRVMHRGDLRRLLERFPDRVLEFAGPAGVPRGSHPWQFDMGRW